MTKPEEPGIQFFEMKGTTFFFGALFFLAFCILFRDGPILSPDSGGYIQKSFLRLPGYPLVIELAKLGGETYYQWVLVFFQLVFGFVGAFYLSSFLTIVFELPKSIFWIISLVFLSPYIGPSRFGNYILSEGAAYPLYLLSMRFFLQYIFEGNSIHLHQTILLLIPMMLIRSQFLFFYPVIFACLLLFFISRKIGSRSFIVSILVLILSLGVSKTIEKTYRYFLFGKFSNVPNIGMQLIVPALFVSQEKDELLFDNPDERKYFKDIFQSLKTKHLILEGLDSAIYDNPYDLYKNAFNPICWTESYKRIFEIVKKRSDDNLNDARTPNQKEIEQWIEFDNVSGKIAWILIKANFFRYFILLKDNFVKNQGGYFFAFISLLVFFQVFYLAILCKDPRLEMIFFSFLLHWVNIGGIGIMEPILMRLAIYTVTLTSCMFIILLYYGLGGTPISKFGLKPLSKKDS